MDDKKVELTHEEIIATDKIKKLEALLTLEEFEFTDFQQRYINHIIDYIRRNQEIRTAIFIRFKFEGVPAIVAFTTEQFNEIKKILK